MQYLLCYVEAYERSGVYDFQKDELFGNIGIRQVRYYLALPDSIGDLWLENGANIDDLEIKDSYSRWRIEAQETEVMKETLNPLEELFGWLRKNSKGYKGFKKAFREATKIHAWESKYIHGEITRDSLRQFTCKHFRDGWIPTLDFLETLLDILIDPVERKFRISVDEFEMICAETGRNRENVYQMRDRITAYVYETTKARIEAQWRVHEVLMEAAIETEAPDYIKNSHLERTEAKHILWKLQPSSCTEYPDQFEDAKKRVAKQKVIWMWGSDGWDNERAVRRDVEYRAAEIYYEKQETERKENENNLAVAKDIVELLGIYDKETNGNEIRYMLQTLEQLTKHELSALRVLLSVARRSEATSSAAIYSLNQAAEVLRAGGGA